MTTRQAGGVTMALSFAILVNLASCCAGNREKSGMHVTLVELEFFELPSLPGVQTAMQKNYLLSMWDCTCRIATWDAFAGCFEDSGGQLNPLAIRSWALLTQPLDAEAWGESIVRAALSGDTSRNNAGWLQPKYQPQCVA
ncbi:hypothetical protein [Xanthomonas citri]|uniref:hypothetical protein n=1 Tax=Xanthomonas citri TaxID=346 RepID=UPI00131C39FB|nr:hypothetical protein [Xanthomonas citri]